MSETRTVAVGDMGTPGVARTLTAAEVAAIRGPEQPPPPLHPHQHDALVAELRRPEWAGLSADAVFHAITDPVPYTDRAGRELMGASGAMKRLAATRFVSRSQYEAMAKRGRSLDGVMILSDDEIASFIPPAERARIEHYDRLAKEKGRPGLRLKVCNQAPGFPNELLRPWFDTAWGEARG